MYNVDCTRGAVTSGKRRMRKSREVQGSTRQIFQSHFLSKKAYSTVGRVHGIWYVGGGDTSELIQPFPTHCQHLSALTGEGERWLRLGEM